MKVAIVVQRYGERIAGGAEYHARLIAEHMAKYWEVEVLTSDAVEYIHWKRGKFPAHEKINGIPVRRFRVKRQRDPVRFAMAQRVVERKEHTEQDEIRWVEEQGPYMPSLIEYLEEKRQAYDLFIFFSYRYYHCFFGIPKVKDKALLVPTAEHDPVLYFNISRRLFRQVKGFLFNSIEEKMLIEGIHGVKKPSVVVGVGIKEMKVQPGRYRSLYGDYMLYIGRIDRNKGAHILFEYFKLYRRRHPGLKLLLIGTPVLPIPQGEDIHHLGFVSEEEKWQALADSLFLVIPSPLESLSMVTLEAWAASKPVLAYGNCEVLRGQVRRSCGGLYFTNYFEFEEGVELLRRDEKLRSRMGSNGRRYYELNYSWDVIENKYLYLAERVLQ